MKLFRTYEIHNVNIGKVVAQNGMKQSTEGVYGNIMSRFKYNNIKTV